MEFKKDLKILYLDLETMPNVAAVWATGYDMVIQPEAIIQERFILSAQWAINEGKVSGMVSNIKNKDDTKLVKHITKLIESVDIVVGHNVRKFDLRWLAGRALLLGLEPTMSKFVPHVDTLLLAKQAFYLNSYKMDYLCKKLDIPGKVKTSFSDWMAILQVAVNPKLAQERAEYLLKYGKNDIIMNRKLFKKMLPHVKLTKTVKDILFGELPKCIFCNKNQLQKWGTYKQSSTGITLQKYRCFSCAKMTRGVIN